MGAGPRNGAGANLSLPSLGRDQAPDLRANCRCHIWAGVTHMATQLRTSSCSNLWFGPRNGAETNFSLPKLGQCQAPELRAIPRCHIWVGPRTQQISLEQILVSNLGPGSRNGADTNFSLPSLGRDQTPELRAICRCHIWAGATHKAT